jgi:putative membrane protein
MLIRLFITALIVLLAANLLPGVHVDSFVQSIWVAIVLMVLNLLIKPIIILLTIPFTIVTFGLFLLVINAIIIMLCDQIVGGFQVASFGYAFLFSIILSLSQSIAFKLTTESKNKN